MHLTSPVVFGLRQFHTINSNLGKHK